MDFPKKESAKDLPQAKFEVSSLIFVFNILKKYHEQSMAFVDETLKQLNEYVKKQLENCNFDENINELNKNDDKN